MALITLRQLLDHAAENDYGVPAFNINNMEQGLAIMKAAEKANAPVIMQASRGARAFANDIVLSHLIRAAIELYPHIPVCMHQDHGNNEQTCATAIQHGFTSVMMDGSLEADGKTPASAERLLRLTRSRLSIRLWFSKISSRTTPRTRVSNSLEIAFGNMSGRSVSTCSLKTLSKP